MRDIILLILFFISSFVHLYFAFKEDEVNRSVTKVIPMIILIIFIFSVNHTAWPIYIGALCGLIGDSLLLNKKNLNFFLFGTLIFLLGHLLYLSYFIYCNFTYFVSLYYVYIIAFVVFIIAFILIYRIKAKMNKVIKFIGSFYMSLLLFNLTLGIASLFNSNICIYSSIFFTLGYILFILSDSILVYTMFIKDIKRRDFYIMFLYLFSQLLIVFSLIITIL